MDHTNSKFDAEFESLRVEATSMAGLVERQFSRSIKALLDGDLDLVAQVLEDEAEVNRRHVRTDLHCNKMIATMQPIAVDLREIIGVLHMNNDFERIGDEAKKIAKKARELRGRQLPLSLERLDTMGRIVSEMLLAAVDAYVRQDVSVADQLKKRDKEVDALRDEVTADLLRAMAESPNVVTECLSLVFVVQSIERVGDHAKNVAEYVVTVVSGVDPRHPRSMASARKAGGEGG
ncbi:MAG: phosphate signaling complex protein PhoU [Burkholderiaceae bacterium]